MNWEPWGVLVFLKLSHFSPERKETGSMKAWKHESMKNYWVQTPQNLAFTIILQKFRKTSTPLRAWFFSGARDGLGLMILNLGTFKHICRQGHTTTPFGLLSAAQVYITTHIAVFCQLQDPSLRDLVTEMFTTTKRCESVIGTMEDYFNTDSSKK